MINGPMCIRIETDCFVIQRCVVHTHPIKTVGFMVGLIYNTDVAVVHRTRY